MTKKEKKREKGESRRISLSTGEEPSPFTRHMPDDNWYKCYSRRGVRSFEPCYLH